MATTRTYTTLEVPAVVHAAVAALLRRAAGDDAPIDKDGTIDMHGIALVKQPGAQWDIADAKKVHGMLGEAIEAAISDELIFKFLTERVHLPAEKAASLLVEFRELRQGSKETVNPS